VNCVGSLRGQIFSIDSAAKPPLFLKVFFFAGPFFGCGLGWLDAGQMQFTAIEQFPLHGFAGLQSDGRRQGQREVDIESRGGVFGANGLHF
jgi:hypothetical protein